MEKSEKHHSLKTLIIAVALATAFSSFTFWLIESWIKYPLFLFEVFTIIALYLVVSGYDLKTTIKQTIIWNLKIGLTIDLLLIASALSLLTFNILQIDGGLLQLSLALLCTSFLSGYAILNIFGLTHHFSKLENLVLSFILSYAFTGFITFASLPINQDTRTLVVLSSVLIIGSISAFKHKRTEPSPTLGSFSKNIDVLVLLVAVTFFVISFFFMYSGFALLPGTDISRHYANSIILGRTPDFYIGSTYLFSHLHESMFLSISNSSLPSAQTALVMLNLMLPLAFYVMTKPYLEKIDARLASLATLFWVLFTNSFGGFTWIHFVKLKLSTIGQTQLQLLADTADKTYNGTIYGVLGLWYIPGIISLAMLMIAIFLMCKKEIPTKKYLALFSITIAILYLTHVVAATVFALFLAVYGTMSKNQNVRTDDTIKSSIIGFVFVSIIYYILYVFIARFIINTSLLLSLIGPISALLLSLLIRKIIKQKLPSFRIPSKIKNKAFLKTLFLSLLFVYVIAFVSWASLADSFHTWQVDPIGLVPWFMYPLMLGINGVLAIIALYYLSKDAKSYNILALFLGFLIFTFIAGRMISIVNVYFFDAGYWEKRFIWLIKIPLAVLAPIPVIFLVDKLKNFRINLTLKTVASVAMIGTIVLYGVSTTFLNLEYWNIRANNTAIQPSSEEMAAINAFKEIRDNDPKAWLATVTGTSASMATFAAPADQLVLKQILYSAYTAEMAFTQLYRHPAYNHAYIYIHNRDVAYLNSYGDRFLIQYLSMLPIVFENSEVTIYNVSKLSFPQPNSKNMLVIPFDESIGTQNFNMAYHILSQGFYNYTVAYDLDYKALDMKTIILSLDPPQGNSLTSLFKDEFNQTLDSWSVSKGNWQIKNGTLLGDKSSQGSEGVILSTVFAKNFTSSFKVKPMNGDATTLNYVRFVYSWVDFENYRIADILFNTDGYVNVLIRNIVGGIEETYPSWPGLKTDIEWDFGNEYNVTVSVKGTLNEISINGMPLLSLNLKNVAGRIGLGYFRFYELEFDDFSVTYSSSVNLRSTQDYLDYLHSGGRIIILNTNGYGFFADDLFSISNSTVNVQRIDGQNLSLTLPHEISVPLIITNNSKTTSLSYYNSQSNVTPFILSKDYGDGELIYCNVFPIIKALNQENEKSAFYKIFGELLTDLDLPQLDTGINLMPIIDGYVKTVDLSDNVKVQTKSLIFPLKVEIKQITVQQEDQIYTVINATEIMISDFSEIIVESDAITLENGKGLYAVMNVNSNFTVKPSEKLLALKLTSKNETFTFSDVQQFSVTPGNDLQLFARTPNLSASQVIFGEFYTQGSLSWSTRTYGQNLNVTGLTQFSVIVTDSYTAVTNVKIGDSFQRNPPIVTFDEFSTLPTAIFWALMLLPIILGISFVSWSTSNFNPKNRRKQ